MYDLNKDYKVITAEINLKQECTSIGCDRRITIYCIFEVDGDIISFEYPFVCDDFKDAKVKGKDNFIVKVKTHAFCLDLENNKVTFFKDLFMFHGDFNRLA